MLLNASRERVLIGKDGNISIEGDAILYVTLDDKAHQIYFYNNRGGSASGASITSFKIPASLADDIRRNAVPQELGRVFRDKPQVSDPTKSTGAYGLPKEYIDKLRNQAIPGTGQISTP